MACLSKENKGRTSLLIMILKSRAKYIHLPTYYQVHQMNFLVALLNIAFFYMLELPPRPLLEKLGRELRGRLVLITSNVNHRYQFHLLPQLIF
jgi:hypothetical protein